MDSKEAARLLANRQTKYKQKGHRKVVAQRPSRTDGNSYFSTNTKEDAIVDAIDQKRFLEKHADWIVKLQEGKIDVSQFLSVLSPDIAIKLAEMAFGADSEKIRLEAQRDWLDRAGFVKVQKVAVANINPNEPKEQLVSLIEGLNKKQKDPVIEIVEDDTQDKEE